MTNTAGRPSSSGAVRPPGALGNPMLTFDLNVKKMPGRVGEIPRRL
jgi:hypothetical protein